ncbi:hypothetical protein B0H17DRAFT_649556 [Mycena rosella]|uniref:Uncharacterized protein n=1 Tax=Mycena rosella TaxID=1033263 RepID=A0AAD7DG16_MYCRO|nr:hypothetical protein B0H17DRAFT_649556 [Mycena rosella]
MRTNTLFRLAVVLGLGSVASHVSAVPNTPALQNTVASCMHDARKLTEPYPRLSRSITPRTKTDMGENDMNRNDTNGNDMDKNDMDGNDMNRNETNQNDMGGTDMNGNETDSNETNDAPNTTDKNYVPFPRPAEPEPPLPPSESQSETQSAEPQAGSRSDPDQQLVYDPIGASFSEISNALWWAKGDEGLSWRRDEVTGELVPQLQGGAARTAEDVEALYGGKL